MDLQFAPQDRAFQEEVRNFLDEKLTPELRRYTARMTSVYSAKEPALEWQAILHKQGWAAPSWPVEHGGCDWSITQHYIFDVEMGRAGAPPLSPMGIGMCGPVLIGHGTQAQKAHYLPRILTGEDFWCQGYSETTAGSDLASLSMSAVEDGDDLILNGHKIWSTHAHEANMCFCLVRTNNAGRPQTGITFILLDMNASGVSVDPIVMLSGEHIQNTIFFEDVRVPKANIVGQINDGWTVAKYLLEFERGGNAYGPKLLARAYKLRENAKELGALTGDFAMKLAEAEAAITALEGAEMRLMADMAQGGTPGLKASMMKIKGTELSQRLTELGIEIAAEYGFAFQPHHTEPGGPVLHAPPATQDVVGPESMLTAVPKYLNDRAGSIYAGSNEIQRNILAKGQLGL